MFNATEQEYSEEHRELMLRNEKRLQEFKEKMGDVWILHPKNSVTRKSFNKERKALWRI